MEKYRQKTYSPEIERNWCGSKKNAKIAQITSNGTKKIVISFSPFLVP